MCTFSLYSQQKIKRTHCKKLISRFSLWGFNSFSPKFSSQIWYLMSWNTCVVLKIMWFVKKMLWYNGKMFLCGSHIDISRSYLIRVYFILKKTTEVVNRAKLVKCINSRSMKHRVVFSRNNYSTCHNGSEKCNLNEYFVRYSHGKQTLTFTSSDIVHPAIHFTRS